ncbi:non-ribosomal peptide synthetase [Frateuria defendens]|uniref:non-ribosomal peptide synthetase n=1 Tax=Frateuria defendens TaxID=2219559 RepID=UPI0007DC17A8|nr:non-ribosomal peptide synthetase [Frateuria defendens]
MDALHGVSLPLTTAQRGLWVGEKIAAADATMNIAELIEISGPVDPALFLRALRQLTNEADTLRICVVERDGRPLQVVRPVYEGELPYIDVSAEPDPKAAAEAWARAELTRPVDLAHDWLWVSALFKAAEDRYFWYQRAHHVAYDGYSGGMSARRMAELYNAYLEGREPEPSGFGSLASLVEAEAAYRDSDRFRRDREYWKEQLANLPEAVTLSRNSRRHSMGGLRHSVGYLPVETAQRLAELGKLAGASLPQVLIGLVGAYYHRATGANDLVMGMPVSGRINHALRSAPGMVANAVSIRLAFGPETTATELFAQVAKVVRQSLRHQQYRYEDLRRDLGLIGQGQHLAWLGVNIEPFDYQLKFGEAGATSHNLSNGSAEDLTVFIFDRGNGHPLCLHFDANPAMYGMDELDEHRRRLVRLVEGVLAEPGRPLGQIDILGEAERHRLLHAWNDTAAELDYASIPALLAQQAARTPDAPAVVSEDSVLSYRELHERSLQQARRLLADGVRPGDIVAVALPRDEQLVVVLLAIMRAGAAYLPIDPDGPAERVAAVLEDARPVAMIARPALRERFARGDMLWLAPGAHAGELLLGVPAEPDFAAPEATAYVLFTSGSTGRPKGVAVSHHNLHNFLEGMRQELKPTAADRFLAVTTILFDIAGLELYLPLRVGARVVMASSEAVRHPPMLARLIQRSRATHMQATPSLWRILLASPETRLDGVHAMVGGEALSAELAGKLRRMAARLTQFYGPTETTVWSTAFEVGAVGAEAPPIGRPILNTRLYVLDASRQPVMTGAIGELYIGGDGVAKGYLNRPELTAERFPLDPFAADGRRMYRTGDLVRWRDDGVLEFIGRADDQVKIRGHRVEPGEIESQLARFPGVAEAAVAAHRDPDGTASLAGYLVARPGLALDLGAVRGHLSGQLPEYMIPASLQVLDALPLTPNGKLDRKALPVPERGSDVAYAEPVTAVEKKLASLWQDVLGLERVGLHDNFFELGGDSLSAAEMIARFSGHFAVELPLGSLFEASTIAGLAAYLQRAESANDPLGAVLPLRPARQERPLFCIHPVVGLSWGYASLLRHLEARLPVYGLQSRSLRGDSALPASIEAIAADYIAQIRRIQPAGPYRLLGWSLGGLIGHAITAQLEAQGQRVELLAILDAYPFVTDPARQRGEEARDVQTALHFLGFHRLALEQPPRSMDELADLLCREYDVLSLPLVQGLMKNEPDLIRHVTAVTRNNLELARRYVPSRVAVDVVYFNAAVKETAALEGSLHYHPSAWHPYVGGRFEVHDVDSDHQSMLDAAPAAHIGRVLQQKLDGLRAVRPAARPAPVREEEEIMESMPAHA